MSERWWSGAPSEGERELVSAIDALCDRHVSDDAGAAWDREHRFPVEAMRALAESAWAGLAVPEVHGGSSGSCAQLVTVHRALGRRNLPVAQAYYSMWVLAADAIERLGSPAQRAEWLPQIATGDVLIAFALTEPDSGSDAAALRTRAVRDGDRYVVNGQKVFITGAKVADRIVTAVRTGEGAKHDGISLLLIDPSLPGVDIRPIPKIGLHAIDLCEIFFDDVEVPCTEVLGTVDGAWRELRGGLAKERMFLAAISVGALDDILGRTLRYATEREAFGKPIGAHQLVAERIVRCRVAGAAAAGLVAEAAALADTGDPGAEIAASVAKLFATEAYIGATRECTQVFGGLGFTEENVVARHYRDAKYLEIGGGTSEIQTIVIARSMGLPA